jgi:hypothetical protein
MATEITSSVSPVVGDHLYTLWYGCSDYCPNVGWAPAHDPHHQCHEVRSHPITKVTPKRIYFRFNGTAQQRERVYFIERARFKIDHLDDPTLEALNGTRALHRSVYHHGVRELLHLRPPMIPGRPNLLELRRAMAAAHPDRGGSLEAFQLARARYLVAKAVGA